MSTIRMSCFQPPYQYIRYSNRVLAILFTHARPKLLEIQSTNGPSVEPIKETLQAQMVLVVLVEIQELALLAVGLPLMSLLSLHVAIFFVLYQPMVICAYLTMMQWSWLGLEDHILVACYVVAGHLMERYKE